MLTLGRWKTCWLGVLFVFVALAIQTNVVVCADEDPPFTVPEGFSVQKVAGDSMVHDCFCMTLDGLGRPVVSGPGYIRTLVDDDQDGTFDRSFLWTSQPKQGAQGLWSEGRKLYFVSEGALWLTEDQDGDLAADANAKRVLELPTGGEHDAHAIRRGPDGYWYLIAGNFARDISKLQNDPLSPVSRSRSGTVWRISPDFSKRAVWAHGMRNCYDFDFMPDGQIVTYDSDCEREATLPWYRPTRAMVLGPASDAGWCGQAWKDEDHRITMPLTIAQLGRGSPTGVAVYQHRAFPKKYHDAVFLLDWTFGRVLAVYPSSNLQEDQRIENKVPAEVFMQPSGTAGFAPTDICVAPDGSLLICVGGRGTAGSVYRVASSVSTQSTSMDWFADAVTKNQMTADQAENAELLLNAFNPFDSWSETRWTPLVDKVGVKALIEIMSGSIPINATPSDTARAKLRCAQIMTRLNAAIPFSSIQNTLTSPSSSTRAGGWWLLGRGNVVIKPNDSKWIASVASADYAAPEFNPNPADRSTWELHLGPADDRLRWEAYGIRKWSLSAASSKSVENTDAANSLRRTWLWALARSGTPLAKKTEKNKLDGLIAKQLYGGGQTNVDLPLLDALAGWAPKAQPNWTTRDELEFLTVLQTSLGDRRHSLPQQADPPQPDVLDGYKGLSASRLPENLRTAWIGWALYIAKHAVETDRPLVHLEATRTLAMLEPKDKESLVYILEQITDKSHPTSDIHWLCCSANCSSPRSENMTRKTAGALSSIVRKVKSRGLYTDNQWPIRLQQLVTALLRRDPNLGKAFVEFPVPCCAEDLVLLSAFPVDIQASARKKMREHLMSTEPADWSPAILRYASQIGIDDPFANSIRSAAQAAPNVRSTAIEMLSALGKKDDYELFLSTLESNDRNQWVFAWKGISSLPVADPDREWKAFATIASAIMNASSTLPRSAVLARVRNIAAQSAIGGVPKSENWREWEAFFKKTLDAETFEKLVLPRNSSDWRTLVQNAAGIKGDIQRGQQIFQDKCVLCHGGQSSLGPSLAGVTKRFSREDLSNAIFDPSRDISERYRSIRVLTVDDEIFTGLIVYNAADGTTLQTATGTIVRINQDNIQDKAYSTESLMPNGLMDDKSAEDIASLYSYLGSQ